MTQPVETLEGNGDSDTRQTFSRPQASARASFLSSLGRSRLAVGFRRALRFRSASSQNVSIEQRLTLSPLQKFKTYGRIPFKLLTHVALLIFITLQIVLFTWYRQPYLSTMGLGFVNTFLPEGFQNLQENAEGYYTYYFQSINETLEHVRSVVELYENFIDDSPDTFVYLPKDLDKNYNVKKPITVEALLYASSIRDLLNVSKTNVNSFVREPFTTITDELTMDNPLGHSSKLWDYLDTEAKQRRFFDRLRYMKLRFDVQSLDISSIGPFKRIAECIQWHIDLYFDHLVRGGRLPLKLIYSFDKCENMSLDFYSWILKFCKPYLWCSVFIFFLSIVSSLLILKSIFHRFRLFKRLRKMRRLTSVQCHHSSSFFTRILSRVPLFSKYVSIADITAFINGWNVITLLADFINLITCVMCFVVFKEGEGTTFMLGLGTLLSYIHIIRYFQYYPQFNTLVLALTRALPSIIRFIIGSFPIFLAFSVCATILFGQYADYFEDLDDSSVTLFAVLNGDAMHDVFDMLFGHNVILAYLSRVYLYIFVLLFICGVLNIFILIMEDAYFSLNKKESENNENDIAGFMNTLDDDDIEEIMIYETRKQEAFDEIEKEEGITLDYVLNYESLEDNICRLQKLVRECMSKVQHPSGKAKEAEKNFNRATGHLLRSVGDKMSDGTTTHLERLQKRSENVFKFNSS
uniref:Polycystin cation channel PKD1/PKD2 domain-containing protein n=1 Tax=Percolomonas cosmopolitus TaxID=63605 RepID=A0A7S1KQV2_9EUKA|mmetsp:Transcript_562/g.2039  ORF Transcript_562/g.2039 Transcript_562/m.2039 type:complete len:691 (+) Transcript_562:1-2073(+)